jgi:WD40 repeat protein
MVVCASPNGKHLAVGYQNGMIKIFSLTQNEPTVNFHGHKSTITTLTFTQDSATLISGSKVKRKKRENVSCRKRSYLGYRYYRLGFDYRSRSLSSSRS